MRNVRRVAGFYHAPFMESSYTIGKVKLTHSPAQPRHIHARNRRGRPVRRDFREVTDDEEE